jgi:hypothetical protein
MAGAVYLQRISKELEIFANKQPSESSLEGQGLFRRFRFRGWVLILLTGELYWKGLIDGNNF